LHRSGRTARAGKEGVVATLVLPEQERDVKQMMRKAGITAEVERVTAASPVVLELIGVRAERVEPTAAPVQQQPAQRRADGQSAGRRRRGGRGGQGEGRTNAQQPRRDGGASAGQSPAQGSRRQGAAAGQSSA